MPAVKNALYAQSGGVTSVINASACAVAQTAREFPKRINRVLACKNGITGALNEQLFDLSFETPSSIQALMSTPGGIFGSCRYKLQDPKTNPREFERLHDLFKAHNIGYFFYNGGGDSQDTTHKIEQYCRQRRLPVQCIGIPKTIDNDLPCTDNSPGFGSTAKYIAISTLEASLDIASMHYTSTKVFILETMGRHAGWIAAASGLAGHEGQAPHIILFPEIAFNQQNFLAQVQHCVQNYGYCVVVASEGLRDAKTQLVSGSSSNFDAFGHAQLGGVAVKLAHLVKAELGLKYHYAVVDYLQRSARHIAAQTDLEHAYATGQAAVQSAIEGLSGVMITIERLSNYPYRWRTGSAELALVANTEKTMPREFISANGFAITEAARRYLSPLIQGEAYPPYNGGIPVIAQLRKKPVAAKLPPLSEPENL